VIEGVFDDCVLGQYGRWNSRFFEHEQRIIITEDKLGQWDKRLEKGYDNPPKPSEDVTHGKRARTGSGSLYV
jgi:hypothetical protein